MYFYRVTLTTMGKAMKPLKTKSRNSRGANGRSRTAWTAWPRGNWSLTHSSGGTKFKGVEVIPNPSLYIPFCSKGQLWLNGNSSQWPFPLPRPLTKSTSDGSFRLFQETYFGPSATNPRWAKTYLKSWGPWWPCRPLETKLWKIRDFREGKKSHGTLSMTGTWPCLVFKWFFDWRSLVFIA